jgi:flagellar export protein FliJ
MTRFTFRLQKVLELTELRAQAAASELSAAERRADDARSAQEQIAAVRVAGSEQLAAAHDGSTVGHVQNIAYLLEQMDVHMDRASATADDANANLLGAQSALTLAHQAKRTLDRLRERQLGDWQHAVRQSDNQQMDALALTRFARNRLHLSDES